MTTLDLENTIYTHEAKESLGLTEYRKQRGWIKELFSARNLAREKGKRSGSVCLTNLNIVSLKLDLEWNQVTNSMKAMTFDSQKSFCANKRSCPLKMKCNQISMKPAISIKVQTYFPDSPDVASWAVSFGRVCNDGEILPRCRLLQSLRWRN